MSPPRAPEAIRQGDIPGVQLRCRARLTAPPETAWRWLVEPARLALWLCERAEVEPGDGGRWLLEGRGEDGATRRERGSTLEFEPPRRWVMAFEARDRGWRGPTRLTLELVPLPGGSELSVFQEGFEHLSLTTCLTVWEEYRRRWRGALDRLRTAMGAREAPRPAGDSPGAG